MTTINQLLKNNGFIKRNPDSNNATFFDKTRSHHQYLENFKTLWYIRIEKPTRMCKFYSVYTIFTNKESFEKINKYIACNVYSGKCNRYVKSLQEIEDFIREVQLADAAMSKDNYENN